MKSLPRLFAVVFFPLFVLGVLAGCSGPVTTPTKTLTSIAVTPAAPAHLKVSATQQFTATGTYSDNSTADITSTVTWASGTTATATISTAGLATGVAHGTTQITASMTGVTSPAVTLTVISLTSIAVTPNPASVAVNATIQFTATGTYSDASTANITTQVTWASVPTSAATIGASTGLATGVSNGTSQITATLSGLASPGVTLTVGTGGTPVPIALQITPATPSIVVSQTEDFLVKELLSDGTTQPTTGTVTWTSGTTATASIVSTAGIATGLAAGTSKITATEGSLTGNTTLTVGATFPRFVYTISPNDGVTSGFAINASAGALAPVPPLVNNNSTPLQIAFEPSGQFAYEAGTQGKISTFVIDPVSGVISPSGFTDVNISSFSGTTSIAQSVVDSTGRYLYVLDSGNSLVNAYSIDTSNHVDASNKPTKGMLTAIASKPTIATGATPAGIVVDPLGRFVYVTNGDNSITGYAISADGGLALLPSIGSGPFTSLNNPQLPAIDPAGQFLYVPNNSGSTVSAFTINAGNGALTLIGSSAIGTGLNKPFQAVTDPTGKFLFVSNSGDGTVASFSIGPSGALTALTTKPSGSSAAGLPAGIAADPSGTFVSVANNGENTVTLFSLASGVLTPKFTVETRTIPTFISFYAGAASPVIGPANVFAANGASGNLSGYTATNTTGVLTAGSGSPTTGLAGNNSLAVDVAGTFLFNSSPSQKKFGGFSVVQSTAALTALTGSPFSLAISADAPSDIVPEITSRFVYVADTTGSNVQVFQTGGNTLTSLGSPTPSPFTSVNTIAGDPQGTYLIAFGNGSITSVGISGITGTLIPGGVTNTLIQTGSWTSGAVDPTGHWIVALDSAGKTLQSISFAPIQNGFSPPPPPPPVITPDGTLTAVGSPVPTGLAAPSSVTFDPLGRFVFVSDFTAGTVTAFSFNESTGAVTTTGQTTTVSTSGTGRVSIDASGTYLYAAVTGNGSSIASGVAAYKINADSSLTAVAGSPFPTGAGTSGTFGVAVTSSVQ